MEDEQTQRLVDGWTRSQCPLGDGPHWEEKVGAFRSCSLSRPSQVAEKPGKLEVGGASRDSTGLGALEEGLISS